ncbi:olfactory receptor 6F1-like [Numida meleagris]|uniref:olfactory receptor 6F1-like n=1 Tax=Numida meleagris TaxID=8996 RepID=UPI000B3E11C9|nr:olfactory receptor 6F1-like [Numida meleagris]
MSPTSDVQRGNQSSIHVFILLGFPGRQYLKILLFMVFLITYILVILGNFSIMASVRSHPQLHSPMYFFLCNLSFLEIWYTTVCVPKALAVLLGGNSTISFASCCLQMYSGFSVACTEYFLLAAMVYNRCLAVRFPSACNSVTNCTLTTQLAFGFLCIIIPTYMISIMSFCGPNVINHFFDDTAPWIVLSCTDTCLVELIAFIISFIVILGSCTITLVACGVKLYNPGKVIKHVCLLQLRVEGGSLLLTCTLRKAN